MVCLSFDEVAMPDDHEIARRSLDLQARARDFRMMDLPGYLAWSERKLAEGESSAFIAHLDETSAWLLPEDAAKMTEKDYDQMLQDLKLELDKGSV
jgi:hypothetical protein